MNSATTSAGQASSVGAVRRLYGLFLVAAGTLAYLNSFTGVFLLDDQHAVVDNALLRRAFGSWREVLALPRPIVTFSLAANYALGGTDVRGYHAFNLAVHLCAGLVLYGLVRRTLLLPNVQARFGRVAPELALVIALVWLVHPLQTESVTYVVQRGEALMGLFYLLTLYCLLRGATTSPGTRWYALTVVCCTLGMGSKEVMVTAPLVAALYDRAFLSPSWGTLLRRRWGLYLVLAATWGVLAWPFQWALHSSVLAQGSAAGGPEVSAGLGMRGLSPLQYACSQPGVLLHYLRLALWPDRLCLDYAWPVARTATEMLPAAAAVLALLLATLWAWRRCPPLGFVGAWFFLILGPTSSVMPISDLAVEHRMYLPLAAVVVLVVLGCYALLEVLIPGRGSDARLRAFLGTGLAAGMVLVLGLRTLARNADYQSDVAMWADVVAQRPQNPRGHNNLGKALLSEGQLAEAARQFQQALRLSPDYDLAHFNLGNVFLRQGALTPAIAEYQAAVRLNPNLQKAQNNLGNLLMGQEQLAEAAEHLRKAELLDPEDPLPPMNLAMTLQLQGEWQEAAAAYRRAVALRPDSTDCRRGLAFVLQRLGLAAESRREYERSLRLDPHWPRAVLRDAWDLATNPDPGRRSATVAVQFATQGVEATGQADPQALDVLAATHAEAGDFGAAVKAARQAADLADSRGQADLAAAIRDRLRRYESGKPFRAGPEPAGGDPRARLGGP
jgi:tetratricopeptide (TPR) repeat protein